MDTGVQLPEYQVRSLPENLKNTYIRKRLIAVEQAGRGLEDYEFKLLTPEQQIQYVTKMAEKSWGISNDQFESLTPDQRFQYVMKRAEKGYDILDYKFKLLTPDQQIQYIMKKEIGRAHV